MYYEAKGKTPLIAKCQLFGNYPGPRKKLNRKETFPFPPPPLSQHIILWARKASININVWGSLSLY